MNRERAALSYPSLRMRFRFEKNSTKLLILSPAPRYMGCSGVMHQREKHTQKNPTLFTLEGKVFLILSLRSSYCIFILDFFRDISKIKAKNSLVNEPLRVRKRKLNLYKGNVIKVRSEKLRFHKKGNAMKEIYL